MESCREGVIVGDDAINRCINRLRRVFRQGGENAPAATDNSLAVLPFVNMSGNPAREIVSDGISEELLDDLSDVSALRVAARTSSFAFKDKNTDIKQIARLLSVRSILEGSVREDGRHGEDSVRYLREAAGPT